MSTNDDDDAHAVMASDGEGMTLTCSVSGEDDVDETMSIAMRTLWSSACGVVGSECRAKSEVSRKVTCTASEGIKTHKSFSRPVEATTSDLPPTTRRARRRQLTTTRRTSSLAHHGVASGLPSEILRERLTIGYLPSTQTERLTTRPSCE